MKAEHPGARIVVVPTWAELLPAMRGVIENTSSDAVRDSMWEELARMAVAADSWNSLCREAEGKVKS